MYSCVNNHDTWEDKMYILLGYHEYNVDYYCTLANLLPASFICAVSHVSTVSHVTT